MSDRQREPEAAASAEPGETSERAGAREIQAALHGLRFGSVEVVVHDGRIVRVERREKILVESPPR